MSDRLSQLVAAARANPAPLSPWQEQFLSDIERRRSMATARQVAALEQIAGRVELDLPTIAKRLADLVEDLARHLVGEEPTSTRGGILRFRSKGSLAVFLAGERRGAWADHDAPAGGRPVSAKGAAGGDALDLVAHLRGCGRVDAARWALAWLGDDRAHAARLPAPNSEKATAPAPDTLDHARRIWREPSPADAPISLLPQYLAARGLHLEPGLPIRFHPYCPRGAERWPAMIALMTDPATGEGCGIHRTFLARDGSGKAPGEAKMMLGRAGVVRLTSDEEVTTGLGIAEGIETSLAVMQGFGWRPVWAATSAGAVRSFPVLSGIETLTIFADADEAGASAAEACAARWGAARREVTTIAAPTGDFNDLARSAA